MNGVLLAELAILFEFNPVRVVLLVLHIVVIALFALGACKRDTRSRGSCHVRNSFMVPTPFGSHRKNNTPIAVLTYDSTPQATVSSVFKLFSQLTKTD